MSLTEAFRPIWRMTYRSSLLFMIHAVLLVFLLLICVDVLGIDYIVGLPARSRARSIGGTRFAPGLGSGLVHRLRNFVRCLCKGIPFAVDGCDVAALPGLLSVGNGP